MLVCQYCDTMSHNGQPDLTSNLEVADALERFETALRELLHNEAQRSVDAALNRLPAGPFGVREVEFDVIIRNLTLETRTDGQGEAGPARRRGRPRGAVRAAILASFDGVGEQTTSAVRARLVAAGITTSDDNLHQQLRRLTHAGELIRAGRGLYRRP